MSDSFAAPDHNEAILAQFMNELAQRGEEAVIEFTARYPELADEMRDLAKMGVLVSEAPPEDSTLPERLGDFRIVRRLAGGGMGEVYEAVQEPLGRRVVVKTIRRGRSSMHARQRFIREQAVLAQLHQTHIVPIHAAGEQVGRQYFAMPYIDGAALHHVVETLWQMSQLKPREATPTLADIAARVTEGASTTDEQTGQPKEAFSYRSCPRWPSTKEADSGQPSYPCSKAANAAVSFSIDYYRSVALALADVADALHHAHEAGFLHRDIKPSNIMVDKSGHCWLIDFGLAGYFNGAAAPPSDDRPGQTGAVGTPQYMAPEQFSGQADVRSDVWGLGATLYELLTLRPFACQATPAEVDVNAAAPPPSPKRALAAAPADLAAICLKALREEPAARFQTARTFAEDLRRWLRHEPTTARPAQVPRRVALWARRNPGWAMVLSLVIVGTAMAVGLVLVESNLRAAEQQRKEKEREGRILGLQGYRLQARARPGWSAEAWQQVGPIAAIRGGPDVRDQAAAVLVGLDARRTHLFTLRCGSVAFSPDNRGLLMGGWDGGVTFCDSTMHKKETVADVGGAGPFAFQTNGTPLQLVIRPKDRRRMDLWDLAARKVKRTFTLPAPEEAEWTALSLSADGKWAAGAANRKDGQRIIAVWETSTGKNVWQVNSPALDLELAPDGSLLAVSHDNGRISLWSLPQGKQLTALWDDPTPVQCLAFGRDRLRRNGETKPGWLLAAGHHGGRITVWDVTTRVPRTFCMGSMWDVNTLAFCPDGMTLASAGRHRARVWDIATGRSLLEVPCGSFVTGVAFSPDGKRLAVALAPIPGSVSEIGVWDLENGRGLQTLRGMSGQIAQVRVSPDGRYVAALSHTWKVGVWDTRADKLLHVFEVSPGFTADNAALTFHPLSHQLAFAAGQKARLWDVETGKELRTWELPPGLVDHLAFDRLGKKLLLFRVETQRKDRYPTSDAPPDKHPRVCRLRDLLGPTPKKEFAEIPDFPRHVFFAAAAPDASYFVVLGIGGAKNKHRTLQAYDSTGKRLWSNAREYPFTNGGFLSLDPTGERLIVHRGAKGGDGSDLMEMPSGRTLRIVPGHPTALGPGGERWGSCLRDPFHGFALHQHDSESPVVTLGIDTRASGFPIFSSDGNRIVWGNADGTVSVCDVPSVRRRLAEFNLDW